MRGEWKQQYFASKQTNGTRVSSSRREPTGPGRLVQDQDFKNSGGIKDHNSDNLSRAGASPLGCDVAGVRRGDVMMEKLLCTHSNPNKDGLKSLWLRI